jgi:hypothetical protein
VIPWTRLERRWCEALLAAVIPDFPPLPGLGTIALEPFWQIFDDAAAPLLTFGLRASTVVFCLFGPLLLLGKPCLFTSLSSDERDEMLVRAARSNRYLIRQMATTLKAMACFAYLRDPAVRIAVAAPP